jgi:predicted ATP-grasp superfamily ATP-dependent carboligase
VLLAKGTLENFPITTLLAESSEEFLDPKAASNAVKALSKIIGMDIKTTRLDKEATELSEGVKESVIKAKISRKGPSSEEGGTMYG